MGLLNSGHLPTRPTARFFAVHLNFRDEREIDDSHCVARILKDDDCPLAPCKLLGVRHMNLSAVAHVDRKRAKRTGLVQRIQRFGLHTIILDGIPPASKVTEAAVQR